MISFNEKRQRALMRLRDYRPGIGVLSVALVSMRGNWAPGLHRTECGQVRQCCKCRRSQVTDGAYKMVLNTHYENTTHGYCPACFEVELQGVLKK